MTIKTNKSNKLSSLIPVLGEREIKLKLSKESEQLELSIGVKRV